MDREIIQRRLSHTRRLLSKHSRIHRHNLLTQKESLKKETKHNTKSDNTIQIYARERFLEYMRRSEICGLGLIIAIISSIHN